MVGSGLGVGFGAGLPSLSPPIYASSPLASSLGLGVGFGISQRGIRQRWVGVGRRSSAGLNLVGRCDCVNV